MTFHERVFVDTAQLIGEAVEDDPWRRAALAAAEATAHMHRVTSEGVLQEFLAHFARAGGELRASVAATVRELRVEPRMVVVHHTPDLLDLALGLYDSEFRHTRLSYQDCIAIQIMRHFGISEILSTDIEFALAGFTPLLRRYV